MGRTPIDSHQMQANNSRSRFRIENPSSSDSESVSGVQLRLELITEILIRLPVKSLLKCKCVSKSWLCLIYSPEFIRSHLSLSSSTQEGQYSNHQILINNRAPYSGIKGCFLNSVLHEPSTYVFDVEYPSFKPKESCWIIGIVNGLICLVIKQKDLFIWNPALKKSKHLPSPNVGSSKDCSCFCYGFGYDESNDDYKVVYVKCLSPSGCGFQAEVKVYSLMADSWRRIEDFIGWSPSDDRGAYVGGKIHWFSIDLSASGKKEKFVTLDMVSEKFGELQLPDFVDFDDMLWGVSSGRLYFVCGYNLTTKVDLWVMNKYGDVESWSKVVSIPYVDILELKILQPVYILRNDEIVWADGSSLLAYHPKHKQLRKIELDGHFSEFEAFAYVESLVWPNESCL